MFRLIFLEITSLNRGENQVRLNLPLEAMLPLTDFQHQNRVGSKSQAATQILILYLHDHGFLTDKNLASIKKRTKIFKTDEEFIETKKIVYEEEIRKRYMEETSRAIFIPHRDKELLANTLQTVKTLPLNEWSRFVVGYYNRAKKYEANPVAKEILDCMLKIPQVKRLLIKKTLLKKENI